MKRFSLALLSLVSFSALASDFISGGLKLRGTDIELRATCAKEDAAGKCELVHLFRLTSVNQQQLTAFPVALETINDLKMSGKPFNVMSMDHSSLTGELEGINYVFALLTVPVDAVGYSLGTPVYLGIKSINDAKYNKFQRAFGKGKVLNMGGQPFNFLTEEICQASLDARTAEVMEELHLSYPLKSSDLKVLEVAMKPYDMCGVEH